MIQAAAVGKIDAAATPDNYTLRTRDGETHTCPSFAIAVALGTIDACDHLGALAHP